MRTTRYIFAAFVMSNLHTHPFYNLLLLCSTRGILCLNRHKFTQRSCKNHLMILLSVFPYFHVYTYVSFICPCSDCHSRCPSFIRKSMFSLSVSISPGRHEMHLLYQRPRISPSQHPPPPALWPCNQPQKT